MIIGYLWVLGTKCGLTERRASSYTSRDFKFKDKGPTVSLSEEKKFSLLPIRHIPAVFPPKE